MQTVAVKKPTSLIGKAFFVLRRRPAHVVSALRTIVLFYLAAGLRKIFPPMGVEFGQNVRLQRNRCVMAEAPLARIVLGDDCVIYEHAVIDAFGAGRIEIGS